MRTLAIATLALIGAAWGGGAVALTPISGQTQVQTHAFMAGGAVTDTDSDTDGWSGAPQQSSAFALSSVDIDNPDFTGGGVSMSGGVDAHWAADGTSGSVEVVFGWAFSNRGDVGLMGADFNGLNPNWSYTFRADHDGLLVWEGQVRADQAVPNNNPYGLTGWDLLMDGVTVIDLTDPNAPLPRTGDDDFALVGGQTYTLSLTNFSNIAGYEFGGIYRGRVLGEFFWEIREQPATAVPEPGAWALMLLGFALVGASVRTRRPAAT